MACVAADLRALFEAFYQIDTQGCEGGRKTAENAGRNGDDIKAFRRGSQTTTFVTWGFRRSYNQAAQVPSSNVTCTSPRSPSINCRIVLAFVSMTHSITILPAAFLTAIEILSLCTSMPIY